MLDILDLIQNMALLVALHVALGLVGLRRFRQRWVPVVQGLLFGTAMVLGMMRTVELQRGVIYDGRSVVACLCSLFFGPVAGGIAAAMGVVCRYLIGGVGMVTGILMIVVSALLGVAFRRPGPAAGQEYSSRFLWLFGLLVQACMLLLLLALPREMWVEVFERVFWAVVVAYPLATVLIGRFLSGELTRARYMAALYESREALRMTFYSIGDGVIATDAKGRVQQANAAAEKLMGWSEEEAVGRPLAEVFAIFNEETRQVVENPVQQVLRHGRTVALANHTVLVARDGTERSVADSAAPIRAVDGTMTGVVLVFRDQTAERLAERELLESERRYRTLADSGQALIWSSGPDLAFDYVNGPWLAMTGRTLAEEIGEGWLERVHEEDRSGLGKAYHQAGERREPFAATFRLRRHDGAYRRVRSQVTPRYDTAGQFLGFIGHGLDVTDQEAVQERYETLFRQTVTGLAVLQTIFDAGGEPVDYRILEVNRAFERMTGSDGGGSVGRTVVDLLPEAERGRLALFRQVALTGESAEFESAELCPGLHLQVTIYRPSPDQVAIILVDATERMRATAQIRRNEERLRRLVQVLQQPHESVQGFLDYALEEALLLTGSSIGCIHHCDGTTGEFSLSSCCVASTSDCTAVGGSAQCALDAKGLWREAVRQRQPIVDNDAARGDVLPKGCCSDRAAIQRSLTVPVIVEERIVGVVGVANKATDYDETDVLQLRLMMNAIWKEVGRKEAEAALRASERLLNATQSLSRVGGWEWDVAAQEITWTEETSRIHGLTPADLPRDSAAIIRRSLACYAEGDADRVEAAFRRCVETGEPYDLQVPFTRADGQALWVRTAAAAVWEGGRIVRVVGSLMDVTDRKQGELALAESERQFRELFERAPVGIFKVDSLGRPISGNPALARILGFATPEEGLRYYTDVGQQMYVRPEERTRYLERLRREGMVEGYETEVRTVDGRLIWLNVNARISEEVADGIFVVEGFTTDVTARRQAEQALAESERRVRQKLDTILLPEGDTGTIDLADAINVPAIRSMMEDFHGLTGIGVALLDLAGKPLFSVGWQTICSMFHGVDGTPCRRCEAPDRDLPLADRPGAWRSYRCLHRLREAATSIELGGRPAGSLLIGQFLFVDDEVDPDEFRLVARANGFPEEEYLAALASVPRWNHEVVTMATGFFAKFTELFSSLSYGNIKLARTLTERDQLLDSLRQSESRWRSYLENAPYGVFVADAEGRFLQVNPAACRTTGYTEEELLAMGVADLHAPDGREAARAHFQRLLDSGQSEGELLYLHRSGEERWWHVAAVALGEGRYIGFTADVTDRKQAQAELERIEWMLTKTVPSVGVLAGDGASGSVVAAQPIGDGLIARCVGPELLLDIAMDCLDLLGTSLAVFEADGACVLGILASDWCRALDRASRAPHGGEPASAPACNRWPCQDSCWQCCASSAIATGVSVDAVCHGGVQLHGVPIFVHGAPVGALAIGHGDPPRDPAVIGEVATAYGIDAAELGRAAAAYDSRPPYIVDMARDRLATSARLIGSMVEAKLAGVALAESEREYRTFINSTTDLVAVKDDQLRYRLVNEAMCQFLGRSPAEIEGRTDAELKPPDLAATCCRSDLAALAANAVVVSREDLHGRIYEARKFPVQLQEGKVGVGCFLRDISDLVQAEREREHLHEQLLHSQKMEVVGRLAGGVAHDFNNQLMGILCYAELCADALPPDSQEAAWLEEISNAARHSADLTRQLLAFARRQTIMPRMLDLNAAVGATLGMLRRLIGEDIALVWLPGRTSSTVCMDPSQLDQLLSNLAVNARDAIAGVGTLTIETDRAVLDQEACGDLPGLLPGAYALITVGDDGCGMDEDTQHHIFEPFFTTKAVGQGTGLGLATVYGVVKQNEGSIQCVSRVGEGTVFRIYLPEHQPPSVPDTPAKGAAPREELPTGSETVLLVEDEGTVLRFGQLTLAPLGYTVLAASTPGEAIRLAKEHPGEIHLLLTDVVMPDLNGRELRDRLRQDRPGLKCLFMSGYTADILAQRGVPDEEVNLLEKPFTRLRLAKAVREILGTPQAEIGG